MLMLIHLPRDHYLLGSLPVRWRFGIVVAECLSTTTAICATHTICLEAQLAADSRDMSCHIFRNCGSRGALRRTIRIEVN